MITKPWTDSHNDLSVWSKEFGRTNMWTVSLQKQHFGSLGRKEQCHQIKTEYRWNMSYIEKNWIGLDDTGRCRKKWITLNSGHVLYHEVETEKSISRVTSLWNRITDNSLHPSGVYAPAIDHGWWWDMMMRYMIFT